MREAPNQVREENDGKLNFNDDVWVKITPEGEALWQKNFESKGITPIPPIERNGSGWTRMQLHSLIRIFNSHLYTDVGHYPVETRFRTKDPSREENLSNNRREDTLNLNDQVWVKITPDGEDVWKKYYESKGIAPIPTIERDALGWTSMQFHSLVRVFGTSLNNTGHYPIEMNFRTNDPGLQ